MAFRSIELAIKELAVLGILTRVDGSRERLVQLSATHRLAGVVLALLRAEADFEPAWRSELRVMAEAGVKDGLMAVALIGAGAAGREAIGDPLELLLLAPDAQTCAKWMRQFDRAGKALTPRFGLELKLTCYELPVARRLWATRTPAADRSIREAIPLAGVTPLAALSSADG
ncbi:MAG: hypothetical protein ABJC19_01955 [Gemmatimonadota bacterium]